MTGEPVRRASRIFLAAASLSDTERRAFLDRECRKDVALRAEVEKLLAADKDDSFLEQRAPTRSAEAAASVPTLIGPYRVLSRLGEGGMGEVFLGERKDIGQRVALKVIKLGMDTRAVLARFEAERQALARMQHSNIAKVLDAGATPEGRPYFVMEYVKGAPITRYCDDNKLSVEDRLLLFKQVCSGVQHAHSKGVIHRDLTPNNVLVTVQDGGPVAKIIDFGLARATDHCLTEKTVFTEQGVIMGTPEYMSPEQAGLGSLDIDTRTDVYTLGVMLYELLTGELPFSRDELRGAGYDGMCRTIREKEPDKPSTKITKTGTAKVAQLRRTESDRLLKRLRGDLDWVVLKCLEKDRTRRYETPTHLADDLQRHLDDEVVLARAPSAGYRLQKLCHRYRGQLLALAMVAVAVLAGLVGTTTYWLKEREQAAEAKRLQGVAANKATEAEAQRIRADGKAAEAQRNADRLADKVREFDQLAGKVHLDRVLIAEKELYPAWPDRAAAMRRWLEDAARLLAMRPQIAATVVSLHAARAPASVETATAGNDPAAGPPRVSDESRDFLHDTLSDLLQKLDALAANECKAVTERLAWAERIEALTLAHPLARVTWQQAHDAIAKADGIVASTLYREPRIELVPQTGLVPIGMNPVTKLWEFYELRSAWKPTSGRDPADLEIPLHDAEGRISVGADTGIVLVLLPGGAFTMGAQRDDAQMENYDAQAEANEAVHHVVLAPFFLARHELTQGQWHRLTCGEHPSHYLAGFEVRGVTDVITDANPVEQIDWYDAERWLSRHGLTLPTETQWEYGCRAGTATPWSCTYIDLKDYANLGDAAAKLAVSGWICEEWNDGHVLHAAVGSFRPNLFGLHDMHGNVGEWTRDGDRGPGSPPRAGDGLRCEPGSSPTRVHRGGTYGLAARWARSAMRMGETPLARSAGMGARAARILRP